MFVFIGDIRVNLFTLMGFEASLWVGPNKLPTIINVNSGDVKLLFLFFFSLDVPYANRGLESSQVI